MQNKFTVLFFAKTKCKVYVNDLYADSISQTAHEYSKFYQK